MKRKFYTAEKKKLRSDQWQIANTAKNPPSLLIGATPGEIRPLNPESRDRTSGRTKSLPFLSATPTCRKESRRECPRTGGMSHNSQ
ncbi:hypothetical protein TNCV_2272631 [Trichonephila clavipes]|nr:hypothetical protein TNCV_2272631 [Trichonephila clavipes]